MIRAKRATPKSRATKIQSTPTMSPEEAHAHHSFTEYKLKNPSDHVTFTEHAKKSAEDWKIMPANEQQRFKALGANQTFQYESDDADDSPPAKPVSSGSGTKRKRTPKDPNAPKRNLSAFFHFSGEERPRIKAAYPNYTMSDTAKELGHRWAAMGAEARKPFDAKAAVDKERYNKEKEAHAKSGGVLDLRKKARVEPGVPAASPGSFPEPTDPDTEDEHE